jgi:hypothetical protein
LLRFERSYRRSIIRKKGGVQQSAGRERKAAVGPSAALIQIKQPAGSLGFMS